MEPFFFGSADHQVDAKRRIRIPSEFKKDLGERYVMTAGTDGCILIMPFKYARKFQYNIANMEDSDKEMRKRKRKALELMTIPEEDPQGRLVLSKGLMEFANIDKDLKFVGMGDYIELWAKEIYDADNNDESDDDSRTYDISNVMPKHLFLDEEE